MNRESWISIGIFLVGAIAIATTVKCTAHETHLPPTITKQNDLRTTKNSINLTNEITLLNLDGHPTPFSRWRGRLLLINFWAPWCLPCREEIPALLMAQRKYGRRGFQVVGVTVDSPSAARRGARSLGITYPVLISRSPEKIIKLMNKLGGNSPGGLPFSILIGPRGQVIERHLGAYSSGFLERLISYYLPAS